MEIDNAQDIDIVVPMHDLIEHSNNYSKTSESLWQYYKDELNDNLANSESFKSTPASGNTKDVTIYNVTIVQLKYLRNFRALEMPLINCEASLF